MVSCLIVACGYKTNPRPAAAAIPGGVGLIEARAYPDRVVLRWGIPRSNTDGSILEDLSGFRVYRFTEPLGEQCENCKSDRKIYANVDYQVLSNAVIKDGDMEYSDTKAQPGKTYHYWVSAYNLRGREGPESHEVVVPFEEPPPAPFRLVALNEDGGIKLSWEMSPRSGGTSTFRIYRGQTDDVTKMKPIGRTKWAERYYVDRGVEKGQTYYYSVRALRVSQGVRIESLPSRSVEAVFKGVPLEPPENVKAISKPGEIHVGWDSIDIPESETRYNVYRSTAGRPFVKINKEPVVSTVFMDKDVVAGKEYSYRVSAFPKGRPTEESSQSSSNSVIYLP